MSDNRGGARPNSGRKSLGKVPISTRVSGQAKERLARLAAQRGVSISEMVEIIISRYEDH